MYAKKSSYLHFYFLLDKKYKRLNHRKLRLKIEKFFYDLKYVEKLFYIITYLENFENETSLKQT